MSFSEPKKSHTISLFFKAFQFKSHILNPSIILMTIFTVIQTYDTVFSHSNHRNLIKYTTLLVGIKK